VPETGISNDWTRKIILLFYFSQLEEKIQEIIFKEISTTEGSPTLWIRLSPFSLYLLFAL
jgi:hypothetical protein